MSKKQKKPAYLRGEVVDTNTGEIVTTYNQMTQDKVAISGHYIKFYPRFSDLNLNYKYEGYLNHIIEELLQYETNELRIKGKPYLKLKHTDFAKILEVSKRTISDMMKYFGDRCYIKKNNGIYYLNPRISLKGQKVKISTVLLFIDDDTILRKTIDRKALWEIKIYKNYQ